MIAPTFFLLPCLPSLYQVHSFLGLFQEHIGHAPDERQPTLVLEQRPSHTSPFALTAAPRQATAPIRSRLKQLSPGAFLGSKR